MPAFTFTANATSNQITIAGHGLLTGDGPAAVRNVGGALPGGLAAVTDYWLIRVDNDTLKLATSSSNAMAGTAVDLTTAGSGTNILEVGIPYRRPRTYAPISQLKSADLNGNFDAWTALHALLTGQAQSLWSGISLIGTLSVGGQVLSDLALAAGKRVKHDARTAKVPILPPAKFLGPVEPPRTVTISGNGSSSNPLHVDMPFEVGTTITALRISVTDNATGTSRAHFRLVSTPAGVLLASSNNSLGNGTKQNLAATGLNILVAAGESYTLVVEGVISGSADITVHNDLEYSWAQL